MAEATPEVAFLGATGTRQPVELVTAAGERLALPVGYEGALDGALARAGWIAIPIRGDAMLVVFDGDPLGVVHLGRFRQVAPALDPADALVVERTELDTYIVHRVRAGRTLDSPVVVDHLEPSGEALFVWGELSDGRLVSPWGLVGSDGQIHALSWPGRPAAVLEGRLLVLHDGAQLRLVDAVTGSVAAVAESRAGEHGWFVPAYDETASRAVFQAWPQPAVLAAAADLGLRWFDLDFDPYAAAWLDGETLLVTGERTHAVIDARSGARRQLADLPRGARPLVAVTGRFDLDVLRAAQRPSWRGPIPAAARADLVARSQASVHEAAARVDLPAEALSDLRLGLRVRSCPAPGRIATAASRLGGRPDWPKGRPWPLHEGRPMSLLAQIRCDELAAALPERGPLDDGLLTIFAAIEPDGGYPISEHAVHVEVVPPGGLKLAQWPGGLPEDVRYDASIAVVEPLVTNPDWPELERLAPSASVWEFLELIEPAGPAHRMFGHASTFQGITAPAGYELLLQLDSDPLLGTSFGDGGGHVYVWCPAGALLRGVVHGCMVDLDSM